MILFHPPQGTVLICDFSGFHAPEMVKRRPVVVVSKPIASRSGLCTIVALSTTAPDPVLQMHCKISFEPLLPPPYNASCHWVKGDMIYALSFDRLFPFKTGKDKGGKRLYESRLLTEVQLKSVLKCVMAGVGIFRY